MYQIEPARLLMLGLDSVSLPFVQENRRRLPALAALLESGMLRERGGPAENLSKSVWPFSSTAKPPGEHGQYFPFQWSAADRRYLRIANPHWSAGFDVEPFW